MKEFDKKHFDLLIVGGGIQGVGIARDASLQGLNVLLCEKNDFLNATSSQSSKLIHGGLRYLESFEFKLVQESLFERKTLLDIAKHAVFPLKFLIPKFKSIQRPLWVYRVGLFLYDFLAGQRKIQKHGEIRHSPLFKQFNFLPDQIDHAVYYYDAHTDDFRLGLDCMLDAKSHGAVCLNYCKVEKIERKDQQFDVSLHMRGKTFKVSAKSVVNAAGPWANDIVEGMHEKVQSKIKFGKGVHIVFETDQTLDAALLLEVPHEKRIFFVLPWKQRVLVGTTDTEYQGDINQVEANLEDVKYLKSALEVYVRQDYLKHLKPVACMAGVRPLVMRSDKSSQELSRGYSIEEQGAGMWSVLGGKYTVFREIGEKTVGLILKYLKRSSLVSTAEKALLMSPLCAFDQFLSESKDEVGKALRVDKSHVQDILKRYGTFWKKLLPYFSKYTDVSPWYKDHAYYPAELLYAIDHEFCKTLEDYMLRRTSLFYTDTSGVEIIDDVLEVLIEKVKLSKHEAEDQKEKYLKKVEQQKSILRKAF